MTPCRCPLSPAPPRGHSRCATAARCPPPVPRVPGPRRGGFYAPGGAGPPRPVPTRPLGCARLCLPPLSAPRPGGGTEASGERAASGERSWLGRSARSARGSTRPGAGPRREVAEPGGPSYVPSLRAVPAPRSLPPSQPEQPPATRAPLPSALGCARLPQALGPAPSVPSPSARQVRLGSARPRPRPSLTWWTTLATVRNLLGGRMLCFPLCPPISVSVCLSVCLTLVSTLHLVSPWLPALCPAA